MPDRRSDEPERPARPRPARGWVRRETSTDAAGPDRGERGLDPEERERRRRMGLETREGGPPPERDRGATSPPRRA